MPESVCSFDLQKKGVKKRRLDLGSLRNRSNILVIMPFICVHDNHEGLSKKIHDTQGVKGFPNELCVIVMNVLFELCIYHYPIFLWQSLVEPIQT